MNKHESKVSTLLQNIATKPIAINSTEIQKGILEKLDSYGLDAWTLHSWTLVSWIPDDWTLELCTTGPLDS